MEELQRKKISQKGFRSHLTRLIKKVDAIIDSESTPNERDIATLTSSIEQFNERATLLKQVDLEIANTITGEDELEAEIVESAAIQEAISDKISQVKRSLNRLTTTTPSTMLSVSATEFVPPEHPTVPMPVTDPITYPATARPSVSRLPKLSLPTFSGDPLMWQSFWDAFEAAINSNSTLDGVQKFNYLRAQIQGEASRAIAGLPLTSANYDHAVALLKVRFGQPQKVALKSRSKL